MKKKWIILVLVIAVLISGCTTTTTTQTNPPPQTPTVTATPTPIATTPIVTTVRPTPTATTPIVTTVQPTPTPALVSVNIKGNTFVPDTVTIPKGTTVTWTNGDSVSHTVTSISGEFDSGSIDPGKTYSYTFNQGGTFEYGCSIHTTIPHGKVIVT